MAKRFRFDSAIKLESINSSEESDDLYEENQVKYITPTEAYGCGVNNYNLQYEEDSSPDVEIRKYQSRRTPKCFSRNAQMARENRLKKKIHLAKLEKKVEILKKDKHNLSSIIDSQSIMLTELKKEVRYLKGVLANSSDICMLVKNIHESTKMPISISMNSSLKVCKNGTGSEGYTDQLVNDDSFLPACNSNQYFNLNEKPDYLFEMDNELFSYLNTTDVESKGENCQQIPSSSLEEHNYTRLLVLLNYLEGLQYFFPKFNSSH